MTRKINTLHPNRARTCNTNSMVRVTKSNKKILPDFLSMAKYQGHLPKGLGLRFTYLKLNVELNFYIEVGRIGFMPLILK